MGTHVQVLLDGATPATEGCRPVVYDPVFDEYQLMTDAWPLGSVVLIFCPWCGRGLPESKRDRWYDSLDGVGIGPDDPKLDQRYRSCAWWNHSAPTDEAD
jgi:hypothetical protein